MYGGQWGKLILWCVVAARLVAFFSFYSCPASKLQYFGIPVTISCAATVGTPTYLYRYPCLNVFFIFYFSLKMSVVRRYRLLRLCVACSFTGIVTISSRSKHILCENLHPDPGLWYLFFCMYSFLQCCGSGSVGSIRFLGLPDPDPLVWGMGPRIRIRTKISWIRNTGFLFSFFFPLSYS